MHPICADLFNSKKRILEEGGVVELEKTASGGKDIATLLSGFLLSNSRLPSFLTQYNLLSHTLQSKPTKQQMNTIKRPTSLSLPT